MPELTAKQIREDFRSAIYEWEVVSAEKASLNCIEALELYYWGEKGLARCPRCSASGPLIVKCLKVKRRIHIPLYKCYKCKTQFNVCHGTIFQGSRIPIVNWFTALACISNRESLRDWAKENKVLYRDACVLRTKLRRLGKSLKTNELYYIARKWYVLKMNPTNVAY